MLAFLLALGVVSIGPPTAAAAEPPPMSPPMSPPTSPPQSPPPSPPTSPPAVEQGALRILVVARPGEREARVEELYAGLRSAGLLPVDLDERAGVDRPPPPPPVRGRLADARADLIEAKVHFRDVDLDGTRASADAAVDEVLRMERPEEGVEDLKDALLLKANVALQAGLDDEARTSLVLVARLDPDLAALNAGLYPPSLVEAFAAARAWSAAAPAATLSVQPRVAGFEPAEVQIDGRPPSPSPLRAGPHLVSVHAPGDVSASRIIVLDDKAPAVFAPFLAPVDAPSRRATLARAAADTNDDVVRAQALSALASLCAARAVLFVGADTAMLWSQSARSEGGVTRLPVPSSSSALVLGRATLTALTTTTTTAAAVNPALVGGVSAAVVVAAALVGVAVWTLWPSSSPAPPARPVNVVCCGD